MQEGWKKFIELSRKASSPEELEELFDLFLTIEEKDMLAARMLIVQALLKKELSQREIAEKFHVSISQITRGSNALKRISEEMKKKLN